MEVNKFYVRNVKIARRWKSTFTGATSLIYQHLAHLNLFSKPDTLIFLPNFVRLFKIEILLCIFLSQNK